MLINPVARNTAPQAQSFGVRKTQLHQLLNLLDINDEVRLAQAFTKLNDDVGSTGKYFCLAIRAGQHLRGFFQRCWRGIRKIFQRSTPSKMTKRLIIAALAPLSTWQ